MKSETWRKLKKWKSGTVEKTEWKAKKAEKVEKVESISWGRRKMEKWEKEWAGNDFLPGWKQTRWRIQRQQSLGYNALRQIRQIFPFKYYTLNFP